MSGQLLIRCLVVVVAMSLAACGRNMDDLNAYIDEVKSRPGQRPEQLPEIKPYDTVRYTADEGNARSPFEPDRPRVAQTGAGGPSPDDDRPKEFLEQFPLDALAMAGTLQLGETSYGLLVDPKGLIHRVLRGNYVGQNDGRITSITESEIEVVEIVADGIGGYIEREATISLAD
ncbi:MAG: pilus assembly protein PilP [Pseudomonadota bacterium]